MRAERSHWANHEQSPLVAEKETNAQRARERAVRPRADVALLNAGGVRANIGAGPITYGELYEAFPFDNQFAMVRMTVAQLRAMVAANLVRIR